MMRSVLPVAGALLLCAVPTLRAQSPPESPHELVKDVVYNELQERRPVSLWQYRVDKRVASQSHDGAGGGDPLRTGAPGA